MVLGAMLPDFASMSRARLRAVGDPHVEAGVALHHATDDVFHGAETFVALNAHGVDALEAAGLGRGPARAVAHVGIELLLDGLLLDDPPLEAAYLEAVALPVAELELSFHRDGAARFEALQERLQSHGLPDDYRWPDRVALRLEQILARRPRLALSPADRPRVVRFLEDARGLLVDRLPTLLAEVDEGLASTPRSTVA